MSSLLITTLSSAITTSLTSLWTTTHPSSSLITIFTSLTIWSSKPLLLSTTSLVVSSQSSPVFFSSYISTFSTLEFSLSRSSSVSVPISLTINTNSLIAHTECAGSSNVFTSPTVHAPSTSKK